MQVAAPCQLGVTIATPHLSVFHLSNLLIDRQLCFVANNLSISADGISVTLRLERLKKVQRFEKSPKP